MDRRFVLGLVVSAGMLGLLFWHVNPAEIAGALRGVDLGWLVAAWLVYGLALLGKVGRWTVILGAVPHPDLPSDPARPWLAADALFVGFFGNFVLPARVGEVARSVLYARRSGLPLGTVLTTVAIGRLYDAFVLALIFFAAVELLPAPPGLPAWLPEVARGVGVVAPAGLLSLGIVGRFLPSKPGLQKPGLLGRATSAVATLAIAVRQGLGVLHRPSRAVAAFVVSGTMWAVEVGAFLLLMRAFEHSVPTLAAALQTVASAYASAAPSAPGALGIHQWVTVLVLEPFDVPGATSAAASLAMTAFVLAWTVPLGLFGLWRQGFSVASARALTRGE